MFDVLDHIYGAENAALLTAFGELIKAIDFWAPQLAVARSKNEQASATWLEDPFLFDETVKALNALLERLRPPGAPLPPHNYQTTLENIGARSAKAMLALLAGAGPPAAALKVSGWASRTRAKLSQSTLSKIAAASTPNDTEGQ